MNVMEFIRCVPVYNGDFFFITPGTVHAIKGGTLLLETQQNSDVTYRVYDYDRPGSDGKPRALHIAESIDVITAPFEESLPQKNPHKTINKNLGELVSCPYFSVWTLGVHGRAEIVLRANDVCGAGKKLTRGSLKPHFRPASIHRTTQTS